MLEWNKFGHNFIIWVKDTNKKRKVGPEVAPVGPTLLRTVHQASETSCGDLTAGSGMWPRLHPETAGTGYSWGPVHTLMWLWVWLSRPSSTGFAIRPISSNWGLTCREGLSMPSHEIWGYPPDESSGHSGRRTHDEEKPGREVKTEPCKHCAQKCRSKSSAWFGFFFLYLKSDFSFFVLLFVF